MFKFYYRQDKLLLYKTFIRKETRAMNPDNLAKLIDELSAMFHPTERDRPHGRSG